MTSSIKIIISSIFIFMLFGFALSTPLPGGKSYTKVRIHVPVKHHTHVITKTKVKMVHIGVPIKEKPKKHGWDSSWAYSKKKPYVVLP
ncbi:hypothetical protein PVAND_004542 [Polypedilum vanderplanki]|uniref:Uncharacterized protein n=1 Tax=Polypedilum vanderplanki TaxID=319348 RepID=A0A9J6BXG5_POLVA|nr:hypothetical protein PVAND_004542 [Polypedilum vanderplanki]